MKKITLLAVIAALIMLLSASCSSGVSQEQYKQANDDLAAARTQVQSLQTQTQTLQTQNQDLQTQIKSLSSAVSQEQYKKATDDLAAARTQVQSLQTQIQTFQTEVQTLQDKVKSLQSLTPASQDDAAALASLQKKISQTKPYWALFTDFYQIVVTGQTPTITQIMGMMGKIQAIGDDTLNVKMQAIVSSNMGKTESLELINYLLSRIDDLLK
jgi:peptidoglycan hydrolase CwlO-like protein